MPDIRCQKAPVVFKDGSIGRAVMENGMLFRCILVDDFRTGFDYKFAASFGEGVYDDDCGSTTACKKGQ